MPFGENFMLYQKKKKLAQYEAIHKKSHMDERGASLL
jgi:hypothetical protein